MFYSTEFWVVKKQNVHKMSVVIMKMLKWISRNTRIDRIRNEEIC